MSLAGLRVLDLSRVLAGPTCTQVLGDLGADVIKVERPGFGDDTRKWGPPYLKDAEGKDTGESAYYLSANRNKRSVAVDLTKPEGQDLIRQLLASCHVLVENYKVGDLARYGLSYDQLKDEFPALVYCSITGFGQTGPYAPRAGYDFLAQGMGGMMSLTGEPGGEPVKVGIGNADLLTGAFSAIAILAAIRHAEHTGQGQHIDMALLDCQLAWLSYEAENYLISGRPPLRRGNEHPNIVPYGVFPAADGHLILAIGNDGQFAKFCAFARMPEWAEDPRFRTNSARVANRDVLIPMMKTLTARHPRQYWLDGLEPMGVPAGPVNTLPDAFADPQVRARQMTTQVPHPLAQQPVSLVSSPIRMSATPPSYRQAPPMLGQHTEAVLKEVLGMSDAEVAALRTGKVI